MKFEKFKKIFDESFGKVTPKEFIQQMEKLGYVFKDIENDKQPINAYKPCKGMDAFFKDIKKWESSLYCKECGNDETTTFLYGRTVANGCVYDCKHCGTETLLKHKPKEENY